MAEKKTYEQLEARIRELEQQLGRGRSREYRSRLFSFIFGREENKKWTLSLYNALRGTSYDDPSGITINTIEDVVYMGMKNDLSILVSETVRSCHEINLHRLGGGMRRTGRTPIDDNDACAETAGTTKRSSPHTASSGNMHDLPHRSGITLQPDAAKRKPSTMRSTGCRTVLRSRSS